MMSSDFRSLEGFAFGVQTELMSEWSIAGLTLIVESAGVSSLFFGIITHKALVAFSVGECRVLRRVFILQPQA